MSELLANNPSTGVRGSLGAFARLCAKVAKQIEVVFNWPYFERAKELLNGAAIGMKKSRESASSWLERTAPRFAPNQLVALGSGMEGLWDLHSKLCEFNYPADPNPFAQSALRRQWAARHAEARGLAAGPVR